MENEKCPWKIKTGPKQIVEIENIIVHCKNIYSLILKILFIIHKMPSLNRVYLINALRSESNVPFSMFTRNIK